MSEEKKKRRTLSLEEKYKQNEANIKRLRDEQKRIEKDIKKEKEKARAHCKYNVGGDVFSKIEFDFDNEEFDFKKWESYLDVYSRNIRKECVKPKAEKINADEEPAEEQQPAPEEYQEENRYQYQADVNYYTSEDFM